jgi:hypothetical protein
MCGARHTYHNDQLKGLENSALLEVPGTAW